jgi:putative tricarboxylic transport membrane protein
MMVVFGVIGYVFKKLKYPMAPLVLALVLGDSAETAFRQSMLASNGSLAVFWSNGLVGTIVALALVMLLWPVVSRIVAGLRKGGGKPAARGAA